MHSKIDRYLHEYFTTTQGRTSYDEAFLDDFLKQGPFHHFIPETFGGSFTSGFNCMDLLDTVSYYSLPLGLTLGITGSLFLYPMTQLAPKELSSSVLPRFLNSSELGGMMITEPTGGTDIFGLNTTLEITDGHARIDGKKCWGGLTGRAEHWLVAARVKKGNKLTRRVALVYVPLATDGVAVEEYFDALGLQPIPYGRTRYQNVSIPESNVVTPPGGSALRGILDTLFRSRMGVSAIAAGQCRRLAEEATNRAGSRLSFGKPISDYDQIQYRLSGLRGWQQINQSLWHFNGNWFDQNTDVSGDHVLANAAKVMATDGLSRAADSAVQLFAAAAYKRTHVAGRAFTDARPFQIFEGSNDVLLENIIDILITRYERIDLSAIGIELERYGLKLAQDIPPSVIDALSTHENISQRKKVQCGKLVSWLLVKSILEQEAEKTSTPIEDGLRLAHQNMASLAAELPYMS